MNEKIWLSSPHMSGFELQHVNEVFESNWVAPVGPYIQQFEQALAEYNGIEHVAALSSGTAAIHLALIILGIKPDDEVICSTFTFSASANPICYLGAKPVFVDSERETWNMDPELLKTAIVSGIERGKKPKAIILVHLYGMPAKLEEIISIANEYQIPIIEDAAEALGSSYHGQKLGTFGDLGVYSFNGNKIITTSGGGALVSKNPDYIEKAKFLATQARDAALHYQHSQLGYNYRLSNVCAAIGCGQMKVLEDRVKQRRENYNYYQQRLSVIEGFNFLSEPPHFFSNRWLSCFTLDKTIKRTPAELCGVFADLNIELRPLWKPLHMQPVFQGFKCYTNGVSDALFANGLCLPSGTNLTQNEKEKVVLNIIKLSETTKGP